MSGLSHCVHLILTLIFFPWLLVWICCAVSAGNRKKRKEEMDLLRQLFKEKK